MQLICGEIRKKAENVTSRGVMATSEKFLLQPSSFLRYYFAES